MCPTRRRDVAGSPMGSRPDAREVSVEGRLEDFRPSELIQIIGLLGKSGVLRLQNADEEGLIVFRGGKVIYAASPSVRESLGGLLIARGLIDATELTDALAIQTADHEKRRLGAILVEMGVLGQATLEDVIREQFSTVISEFFAWDLGIFGFEVKEMVDRGEVELEAADFLVVSGVEPTHVLLDAARRADERLLIEDPLADEPDSLDVLVNQATSPTIHGEIVYRLLNLGLNTCGRCLLFAVHPGEFQVTGHVGLDEGLIALAERLGRLEVPRSSPSILTRAVERRHSILARLEDSGEDGRILESLGGPSPSKSVAIPLSIEDSVVLVLYGDCLPEDLGTGRLEELEAVAANMVTQNSVGPVVTGG